MYIKEARLKHKLYLDDKMHMQKGQKQANKQHVDY